MPGTWGKVMVQTPTRLALGQFPPVENVPPIWLVLHWAWSDETCVEVRALGESHSVQMPIAAG